jgi:divalent metal cation (Fe/Co/Zn/Cd) transporter
VAALGIAYAAIDRLLHPAALEAVGIGLAVSVAASIINLADRPHPHGRGPGARSITLEADAHHLLTDVWTSAGVIVGVGLVWFTAGSGWTRSSPCWWRRTSSGPAGSCCIARRPG